MASLGCLFGPTLVQAGEPEHFKQSVSDAEEDWKFKLAIPSWLAGVSGDIGVRNRTNNVDVRFHTFLRHLDMTGSFSMEARKGRLGVYGDFLYLSASDGIGRNGLLSKVDLRVDQYLADLEGNYRLVEGRRGWLDLRAGVRYTNLYDRVILHPNEEAINQASARFVDETSKAIAKELPRLIQGKETELPLPPLTLEQRIKIQTLILAAKEDPELAAVLKSRVQSRITEVQSRVQKKIADILKSKLNQTLSLAEDWFDPYVGLGARYNLNQAFYLTAKGDIGGFGVGSKLTYQAYGALGCQITRNIFSEVGYRYLFVNYQQNGFLYDIDQKGAQVVVGINF